MYGTGGTMASTSKCPFCGSTISSTDKVCPSCGAPNENYVEDTPRTVFLPKTIEELKEYCAERGMPLLRMRFFIGEDYKEPKAFGIYQDGNDFVVYKNKANGQRAVRYRGPDEAHAVDELFTKLLEECHNRGIYPDGKPGPGSGGSRQLSSNASRKVSRIGRGIGLGIVVFFVLLSIWAVRQSKEINKNNGYYYYNNQYYYKEGYYWYTADSSADGWSEAHFGYPEEQAEEYYVGEDFDSDWGVKNFEDFKSSSEYQEIRESHTSSSSDYDSWDSGDTDWDSDW